MGLKKSEDIIAFNRGLMHLKANPAEHYFKGVKTVTQEFMMSPNFVFAGVSYEPQQKHIGCGIYQLFYKKVGQQTIKV